MYSNNNIIKIIKKKITIYRYNGYKINNIINRKRVYVPCVRVYSNDTRGFSAFFTLYNIIIRCSSFGRRVSECVRAYATSVIGDARATAARCRLGVIGGKGGNKRFLLLP